MATAESIQVFIRIKPKDTTGKIGAEIPMIGDDKKIKIGLKEYNFDGVFRNINQNQFYETNVRPYVTNALNGYSSTVILIGQKGSGKKHTLFGKTPIDVFSNCQSGSVTRSFYDIFKKLCEGNNLNYIVKMSFLAFCKDSIIDLLKDNGKNLRVFEDTKGDIGIENLNETHITGFVDVNKYINQGLKKLQTLEDNQQSFFHLVISIKIVIHNIQNEHATVGKINFVKLAGPISRRESISTKLMDNTLSSFERMIKNAAKKAKYNPYRSSNLTYYLKTSFGGDTKTGMIATVSFDYCDKEETIETLNLALETKKVINIPSIKLYPKEELQLEQMQSYALWLEELVGDDATAQSKINRTINEMNQTENIFKDKLEKIEKAHSAKKLERANKTLQLETLVKAKENESQKLKKDIKIMIKTVETAMQISERAEGFSGCKTSDVEVHASNLSNAKNELKDTMSGLESINNLDQNSVWKQLADLNLLLNSTNLKPDLSEIQEINNVALNLKELIKSPVHKMEKSLKTRPMLTSIMKSLEEYENKTESLSKVFKSNLQKIGDESMESHNALIKKINLAEEALATIDDFKKRIVRENL